MSSLDFVIIGAQKAATTFVQGCLREHRSIAMPIGETPHFEDPYYRGGDLDSMHFVPKDKSIGKVVGIKRPDYLARPECPARIHKLAPNARLIAILRNPVERAVSAYYWYMKQGYIPIERIEKGMGNLLAGAYENRYPKSREIIDYGLYRKHLTRFLGYFDPNQLYITLYSDVRANPLKQMQQYYRFLEVDGDYVPRHLSKRPKSTAYSIRRLRWISAGNFCTRRYVRSSDNTIVTATERRGVVPSVIRLFLAATDRLFLAPFLPSSKPELTTSLRNRLIQRYQDDIDELEDLLHRSLKEWTSLGK